MKKSLLYLMGGLLLGIILVLPGCEYASMAPWSGKIKILFTPTAGAFEDGNLIVSAEPENTDRTVGTGIITIKSYPTRGTMGSVDTSISSANFGIGSYDLTAIADLDADGIIDATDYYATGAVSLIENTNPEAEFLESDFSLVPSSSVGQEIY